MIWLFLLVGTHALIPNKGPGGLVNLNASADATCSVAGVQQTLKGFCEIPCSGKGRVDVFIEGNYEFYHCYPEGFLKESVTYQLYDSIPTNFTAVGAGFYYSEEIKCRIGTYEMPGTYINEETVQCIYKSVPIGVYLLSVSFNKVDWLTGVPIYIYNTPRVAEVTQDSYYQPEVFTVKGRDLNSGIQCLFSNGEKYVINLVSSREGTCQGPQNLISDFSVTLLDSEDFQVSRPFALKASPKIELLAVIPKVFVAEELEIIYQGSILETIECYADSNRFQATWDDYSIKCLPSVSDGQHELSILTQSGQTISKAPVLVNKVSLTYTASFAELQNHDLQVSLETSQAFQSVFCKWGNHPYLEMTQNSPSEFLCKTSKIKDVGEFCIELSFNGLTFSNTCEFKLGKYRKARLSEISQSVFALGGTEFFIETEYIELGPTYKCRFSLDQDYEVEAFNSGSRLNCTSPSQPRPIQGKLTVLQGHYQLADYNIAYIEGIQIEEFSPSVVDRSDATLVNLVGSNFQSLTYEKLTPKCRWKLNETTLETTATYISETQVSCQSPSLGEGDVVELQVQNLDLSFSPEVSLTLVDTPQVSSTSPGIFIDSISNPFYLHGSEFSESLVVEVAQNRVKAEYISSSLAYVPYGVLHHNPSKKISVKASNDEQNFSEEILVSVYPAPFIGKLSFYGGPHIGGDTLNVYGSGFQEDIWCVFGDKKSPAKVNSYSELECQIPNHNPGKVSFSLELNNWLFTKNPKEFEFLELLEYSLSPNSGSEAGGTEVTLKGSFSFVSSEIKCLFGNSAVEGQKTQEGIVCTSPEGQGEVQVRLEVDQLIYTAWDWSSVTFKYFPTPSLTSLSVSKGPSRGGTLVEVKGSNLSEYCCWYCNFGGTWVPAFYLSESARLCEAPSKVYQKYQVKLSSNMQEESNSFEFEYLNDMQVTSLEPGLGPGEGNTQVTIFGKNLENTLNCRFGSVVVEVDQKDQDKVKCTSPKVYGSGVVAVDLSENGQDFTGDLKFEYIKDMLVERVQPPFLFTSGNTEVILYGSNFVESTTCRVNSEIRPTQFVSQEEIKCSLPETILESKVSIELTSNLQNFESFPEVTNLQVYPDPAIDLVSPNQTITNTLVTATVKNLVDSSYIVCKVGGVETSWRAVSSDQITCVVPSLSNSSPELEVSLDSVHFQKSYKLSYGKQVIVYASQPYIGKVQGGTAVRLNTLHHQKGPELLCYFDMDYDAYSALKENTHIVTAEYVNSREIICRTPQVLFPMQARIRVTSDSQQYSSSSAEFVYIQSCRGGIDCTEESLKLCPKGHYCPFATWYQPQECPEGTYQDLEGQSLCKACPPGFYCNTTGLHEPLNCPEQMVCQLHSTVYLTQECPSGFLCSEGTQYLSPLNNYGTHPTLCPEGSFCNSGTSKKCLDGFLCLEGSQTEFGIAGCPPGYYCSGTSISECPEGHYCPSYYNKEPRKCPPGTYNSFKAQSNCTVCPLGYICPDQAMTSPNVCPPGYICNIEGIQEAQTLCTAGYYCSEGVETNLTERPCIVISQEEASDLEFCKEHILLKETDPENYSQDLEEFNFTSQNLCCWSPDMVKEFILSISKKFESQAEQMKQDQVNGLGLYKLPQNPGRNLLKTAVYFEDTEDQALVDFWLEQLTRMKMPQICPEGVFCLEGTASSEVGTDSKSAYVCNTGTYCEKGSSTPQGTGLCPEGSYCPEGTSEPIPTSPGYITTFPGNTQQKACSPGYFANGNNTSECIKCPSGYECNNIATIWPEVCREGQYRDYLSSNQCIECPRGTWSFDLGLVYVHECLPCPAGRICSSAGYYNSTLSETCLQGEVCEEAATVSVHEKCPPGFVCGEGVSPQTKYNSPCEAGFFCGKGTAKRNQYLNPCPEFAYCPPGTFDYSEFFVGAENTTSEEIPPTMCPQGTGKDNTNGRETLLQCNAKEEYRRSNYLIKVDPIREDLIRNANYKGNTSKVFKLDSREVALVTLDLRHLNLEGSFSYGVNWAISFTVKDKVEEEVEPADMPQAFLNETVSKSAVLEFSVFAWEALEFKVDILVYNGLFHSYAKLFENTTSVEVFTPQRANYGTKDTFLSAITPNVALPINVPPLNSNLSMPNHLLAFSQSPHRANLLAHQKQAGVNWFMPNSNYWQSREQITLPYLPYFSNCKGFDTYIPIWAVLELYKECTLVPQEETEPVPLLSFGFVPKADKCENVEIECIYDEVPSETLPLSRWFEMEAGSELFYLYADPVNSEDLISGTISSELVPVVLQTQGSTYNLPTQISLEIFYHQIDQSTKRIIEASVYFLEFKELSIPERDGQETVSYKLSINYRALNHRELMNRFIFGVDFYMGINFIVGVTSVVYCVILLIYHRVLTRIKPVPKFKFWTYLAMMTPAPLKGIFYAMTPIVVVLTLVSIFVMGNLFDIPISQEMKSGIFAELTPTYGTEYQGSLEGAKYARVGVGLLMVGSYLILLGSSILIPSEKKQEVEEDHMGNVWHIDKWKRANLVFLTVILIVLAILLLQFSFSEFYGENIWTMIAMLVVLGKVFEYFALVMLKDNLLVSPFAQSIGIIQGLVTFGAGDFVEFVLAYFVEYLMMIMSRLYLDFVVNWITESIENAGKNVKKVVSSVSEVKKLMKSFKREKKPKEKPFEVEEEIEESSEHLVYEEYEGSASDSESVTIEKIEPTPPQESNTSLELPPEQEVEPLLEAYQNYANDLIVILYSPIFIGIIWNFYDTTQIAANYEIMKEDFDLYFLFSIMILPFQLVMDVFLHNCNEYYNGWAIHDFLDYMNYKFKNRNTSWSGFDYLHDNVIEEKNRTLYRMCFSSQFFFICTIYTSAIMICILGVQAVIINKEYNIFDDKALVPVVLLVLGLCVLFHFLSVKLGQKIGIWRIGTNQAQQAPAFEEEDSEEEEKENRIDQLNELFNEIYNPQTKYQPVPKIPNWNQVEILKAKDEMIKRDLNSDRLTSPEIRRKFLEVNLEWLQDNLESVFTPRTLESQKSLILSKFSKMFGDLEEPSEPTELSQMHSEAPPLEVSGSAKSILKYWVARAKRNRDLQAQIDTVLTKNLKERCILCRSRFGLQCQMIESIETMFFRFINITQEDSLHKNWNRQKWIAYVGQNAHFRTICLVCLKKCEEFNYHSAQNHKKPKVYFKLQLKETTKQLALSWLNSARKKLKP